MSRRHLAWSLERRVRLDAGLGEQQKREIRTADARFERRHDPGDADGVERLARSEPIEDMHRARWQRREIGRGRDVGRRSVRVAQRARIGVQDAVPRGEGEARRDNPRGATGRRRSRSEGTPPRRRGSSAPPMTAERTPTDVPVIGGRRTRPRAESRPSAALTAGDPASAERGRAAPRDPRMNDDVGGDLFCSPVSM